ncbi:26S proteasome non-ATPase regulatory subunit 7-like B [Populus alba x Populus x berolinensis]|nr:26S proteasome non-ATPase regulatory subunit 7-like B [Populus alba x Populus x berolinensis]
METLYTALSWFVGHAGSRSSRELELVVNGSRGDEKHQHVIVDNYNRVAKDTRKRVVGSCLAPVFKGTVDATNSYAELGIPTKAYYAVEEVKENATQKSQKVFVHVQSEIAAHEVEEIGVEHLLRDVKDTTISTHATEVTGKLSQL